MLELCKINILRIILFLHSLHSPRLSVYYSNKSLKTLQSSYLCSLHSFPSHRCTHSSSLITLSRHSLTSRLKIANRSDYYSAPVLWNSLPIDLRHVAHHVTLSPVLNSPVAHLSTLLFLKKLKPTSFISLVHLGYLWTEISGTDQTALFDLILILLSFTSFHSCNFYFIWRVNVYE